MAETGFVESGDDRAIKITAPKCAGRSSLGFSKYDLVAYFLLISFLFLSFEQNFDIFHTIGSSVTYLNGHIRDFYDINATALGYTPNYLPSTYVLFAIWGVPLRLLGLLPKPVYPNGLSFLWFKLMTTVAYFGTAAVLYRIGLELGLSRRGTLLLAAAWVTTPIAVFSQFIFGQYDILTVLFTLVGFLYCLRCRNRVASLFFGIAITFKYFPVFLFLPLLFLTEKRPREVLVNVGILLAPAVAQVLLYIHSEPFREAVLNYGVASRVFSALFLVGEGHGFSILFFMWFILCGWAYLQPVPTKERLHVLAVNLSVAILSVLFLLVYWHPNWLLLLTPFLVLSAVLRKDRKFYLALDVVMMAAFVAYAVSTWPNNVDQNLWARGIFGSLNPGLEIPQTEYLMRNLLPFSIGPDELWLALFNATLVLSAFAWMWKKHDGLDLALESEPFLMPLLRVRFVVGISIYLVPAILAYFLILFRP